MNTSSNAGTGPVTLPAATAVGALTPVTAVSAACDRLGASRLQLRLALRGPVTTAAQEGLPPPTWWTRLLATPGIDVLHGALRNWWTRHPWHTAGTAAAQAVQGALRPMAQRHPWALAAAALLAGGLVVASRPWRWRAQVATGAAGKLPRMLGELLGALPTASWLVLLAALTQALTTAAQASPGAGPMPDSAPASDPAPPPNPDPPPNAAAAEAG